MITRGWMILLLLVSSVASANESCPKSLALVMDQYVKARGGIETLDEQHGLRILSTHHEGRWNPSFDYRIMKPGYMWITAVYDDGEVIIEGFDGRRGWEKWAEKPAEYVGGDAEKGVNQGAVSPVHLYGLNHMADLGAKVTLLPCEVIDGVNYVKLNIVSSFGTDIDYFLNSETYRLERARAIRPLHPTQDPTPIPIEERWSDFRTVNGVLHPFGYELWRWDTEERLAWLETHSIEPLDTRDPEFFAKPD